MNGGHIKRSIRLRGDLARRLADHAVVRRSSQAAIIEAALESFLSPDASDRLEAALARRLDRMGRDVKRLEWHVELTNETLALFIRFWFIVNAPLPDSAMKAAQVQGRERWERFVETLNRQMELGPRFRDEVAEDISASSRMQEE